MATDVYSKLFDMHTRFTIGLCAIADSISIISEVHVSEHVCRG